MDQTLLQRPLPSSAPARTVPGMRTQRRGDVENSDLNEQGRKRVEYWLNEWSHWYAAEPNRLGFPHHVTGVVGGGHSRRGDEWEDEETRKTWHRNCRSMDALIESLPPSQCCAVRHVYLGEPWRFPRENQAALLEAAETALLRGMNARAVL